MVQADRRPGFKGGWSLCSARVRYLKICDLDTCHVLTLLCAAESRAPGQRARHPTEDSSDDYEGDLDKQGSGFGGRSGRIILLGNGTEVVTDSDEQEVFDHEDDDRDLENQISKHSAHASKETNDLRNQREDTPGPSSQDSTSTQKSPESTEINHAFDSPSSTVSEPPEPTEMASTVKPIPESALPDKLTTPPTSKEK